MRANNANCNPFKLHFCIKICNNLTISLSQIQSKNFVHFRYVSDVIQNFVHPLDQNLAILFGYCESLFSDTCISIQLLHFSVSLMQTSLFYVSQLFRT